MRINLPYVVAVIGVSYVVMSDAQYRYAWFSGNDILKALNNRLRSSTVVIEQTIIVTPSPSPSQNALSVLVSALQSPDWQPPEAMRVRSIGNSSSTVEIIAPTTLSIPLGNQTSVLTTTPTTESREGNASGITVHSSLETAQGTPTSAVRTSSFANLCDRC